MKFNEMKEGQKFLSPITGSTCIKVEELEIRNLDGDTWWINAISLDRGEFFYFDEEDLTLV